MSKPRPEAFPQRPSFGYQCKLERFEPSEHRSITSHDLATLHFYRLGSVVLSKTLCERLNLKYLDRVSFFQDKNRPQDWYMAKDEQGEFQLRVNSGQLCFCSRPLCEAIAKAAGEGIALPLPLKFNVGTEAIEEGHLKAYPIITSNNLLKNKK